VSRVALQAVFVILRELLASNSELAHKMEAPPGVKSRPIGFTADLEKP
jgi:hypothetical protein